jgi:hypothetical protein
MNKPIPDELPPVCGCGRPMKLVRLVMDGGKMKLVRLVMDGGKACLDYWACTAPTKQCPVKNANIPVDIIWEDCLNELE